MKLLIVTQTVDPAHPVLGFFMEWLRQIQQHPRVDQLHVISLSQAPDHPLDLSDIRITYVGHPNKWVRLFRFWNAILWDASDSVLVHMTPPWLIAGFPVWFLKQVRMALWYTHGSTSRALRWAVRLSDVALTATQDAFPFKHAHVQAIGHGIGDAFGSFNRVARPEDRFAILAVGRVTVRKRALETVKLFKQLHERESRATLDWIGPVLDGDAEYFKQVQAEVTSSGLQDRIRFLPALPAAHMPAVYGTHDLLLHLSETGSLDKVVIESLAAGCPVFSTNPATIEGVGERWGWKGNLDANAPQSVLDRLRAGMDPEERRRISAEFSLPPFIDRLIALTREPDSRNV